MRVAYFDCFAGISGDMTLGALIDAGADEGWLRDELGKLRGIDFELRFTPVIKKGIRATNVEVITGDEHPHRHLTDIVDIIGASTLADNVKSRAIQAFTHLAEAEAVVHGTTPDKVHFHEVGAVDAIVDIVGSVLLVENLGLERIYASPLPMGHGFVESSHGRIPLPAPATVQLLKGIPIYSADVEGELVTPTGAALIRTLASEFGGIPQTRIQAVGYGAGKNEFPFPNVLRVFVGEATESDLPPSDRVSIIETNIDDMNPEFYDSVMEKLFKAGALDVYLIPIVMKKGRPATLLSAICPLEYTHEIASTILRETTTFGVRIYRTERRCLERTSTTVATRFGDIRVKIGSISGTQISASPEYEDCRAAAENHGVPIRQVYDEAMTVFRMSQTG